MRAFAFFSPHTQADPKPTRSQFGRKKFQIEGKSQYIMTDTEILIEQIFARDKSLSAKVMEFCHKCPIFALNGSGCRSAANLLDYAVFRCSVYLSLLSATAVEPFVLMITASHNPASENGFKIGTAGQQVVDRKILAMISEGLNDFSVFESHIRELISKPLTERRQNCIFIGWDCRPSSEELFNISSWAFDKFNIKSIVFGRCSTPELFSLSTFVFTKQTHGQIAGNQICQADLKSAFVGEVIAAFQHLYGRLLEPHQGIIKPKVMLDFANGSGAVSFGPYNGLFDKFFTPTLINDKNFSLPNYLCGAEHIYKNWQTCNSPPQNENTLCFYFDGDSDRIICRIEGQSDPFDGDCFLFLYVLSLKKLIARLPKEVLTTIEEAVGVLQIRAVGNLNSNQGVIRALRKLGIKMEIANVGIQNLYETAWKDCLISVFFEPNGHGGILFSEKLLRILQELQLYHPDNLELQLLITVHAILRNNSRGYALHNALIFTLFQSYIHGSNTFRGNLYTPFESLCEQIRIPSDIRQTFTSETNSGNNLPQKVNNQIEEIIEKFPSANIVIRKSDTEKGLVRLQVQAEQLKLCSEIMELLLTVFCSSFREHEILIRKEIMM